jgi:hypothetical protein
MKLCCFISAILFMSAVPAAAQLFTVQQGQTLIAEWVIDCTNICDQPIGTAGFRLILDGTVLVDVGISPTGSSGISPLPGLGRHTLALEAYNCGACIGGEVTVRGTAATFEVVPADPLPPNTPSIPTLVISP